MAELLIDIIPSEEDCYPDDACSHHDKETIKAFESAIEEYGLWGWCMVTVRARYGPFTGESHLGACSYANEQDFREGGYFEQMRDEAVANLKASIAEAMSILGTLPEELQ